jgi:hypothetical protein
MNLVTDNEIDSLNLKAVADYWRIDGNRSNNVIEKNE